MQNQEQDQQANAQPERPPEPTVDEKAKEQKALAIKIDDQGLVKIETLSDELSLCKTLVSAGMVPSSLDTPQKLFAARQLCRELGLPVMSAIRQVYVVNGTPTLWGDTPLALVRRSGLLLKINEYFVDENFNQISVKNKNLKADVYAAVCEVQRKGDDLKEFFFTKDQAETAGLYTKNRSLWKVYPLRMIQLKARGLALKNEFSDILMGVGIAEYDYDEIPGVKIRDVGDTTADKANQVFGVDEVNQTGSDQDSNKGA